MYRDDYKYTKEHEWIHIQGDVGTIGVTQYAVDQLGDVVHLELPEVGARFGAGESFGTIESTKTVSDLYSPVTGEVIARNEDMLQAPEDLPGDPHDKGWLIKLRFSGTPSGLMTASEYQSYIKDEAAK
jgi:glycine cleavage system H protein